MYDVKELLKSAKAPAGSEKLDFRFIIPLWRMDDYGECLYVFDEEKIHSGPNDGNMYVSNKAMFCGEADVYNFLISEDGSFRNDGMVELMSKFISEGASFNYPEDATPEMKAVVYEMASFRGRGDIQGFIDRYFKAGRINPDEASLSWHSGMPG